MLDPDSGSGVIVVSISEEIVSGISAFRLLVVGIISCGAIIPGYSQVDSIRDAKRGSQFNQAVALSVDPGGNIFVIDKGSSELIELSADGNIIARTGGYGWSEGAFDQPTDVIAPNGLDVYVADFGNHRIRHFDRNLNAISVLRGRMPEGEKRLFGYPMSVALSRQGELFVLDGENNRVVKFRQAQELERMFGGIDAGEGRLDTPTRIRVDDQDRVIVQDGNRLKVYDRFGNFLQTIGDGLWKELRGFTASPVPYVFVDSCRVISLHPYQEVQYQAPTVDRCKIVDFVRHADRLYFLTPHRIEITPFLSDSVFEDEQRKFQR